MAILAFQKPDKVVMLEANDKFGKFEFRPLEPGFGVTIGNALRRILLSSLEGYAINTIKIAGVEHEFSSVPGVKEDVTNIILNLKQVRFKQVVEEFENEKVSVTVENSCSTPSILMVVIAKPSNEERRIRRNALPTVIPKPGSNGRNSNLPNLESASNINTLSGF